MTLVANPLSTKMSVDEKLNRTYTSKYQVPEVPLWASPLEVMNATGIPNYLSYYSWGSDFDLYAGFKSLEVDPKEDTSTTVSGARTRTRNWEVTFIHSTDYSGNHDQNSPKGDPTFEPAQVSGSYVNRNITAVKDKDGNPIINTAGDPINPMFQINDPLDSLNITFNTATLSLSTRASAKGRVNSASLWGLGPRQILLNSWKYSVKWVTGYAYIVNNLEFLINTEQFVYDFANRGGGTETLNGYWKIAPNRGYSELVSGKRKPILIRDLKPNTPQMLNSDGTKADVGSSETWNAYALEKEFNFASISGLPAVLPGPFV